MWFVDGKARVVNTSSVGHWFAPKGGINYSALVPNDTRADELRMKLGTERLYAQSKWVCQSAQCPRYLKLNSVFFVG